MEALVADKSKAKLVNNPRVFISYAHESQSQEWMTSALAFTNALRAHGIDADIDQYDIDHVGRDWGVWGVAQVASADLVICLASPQFNKRWYESAGSGVSDEARAVRAKFSVSADSIFFVVLPGSTAQDIPAEFSAMHRFEVATLDRSGLEAVLRAILQKPTRIRPAVGSTPSFPDESDQPLTAPISIVARVSTQSTDNLGASLSDAFAQRMAEQKILYSDLVENARKANSDLPIRLLLAEARRLDIVEAYGVRIQIRNSWNRVRFEDCGHFGIRLTLETQNGESLTSVMWSGQALDAFEELAIKMQARDLMTSTFDPSELISTLVECIERLVNTKTQGHQFNHGPLIEPIRGPYPWILTLDGIESSKSVYVIDRNRLDEDHFRWHVAKKAWVDEDQIIEAWDLAEALFGEDGPAYLKEAIQRRMAR